MQLHFRTIWISDTHLGGKNLNSKQLYDFLLKTESDYLYLVGDIIDFWQLKKKWFWPEINDRIVKLILKKAGNGTRVFYIPGNHDGLLRKYTGMNFSGIRICNEIVHETVDGGRFLTLHGDSFDCVVQKSRWLANLGSGLYEFLLNLNRVYNKYRKVRGKEYFSISTSLKHRCKKVVNYIGSYEEVLAEEVKNNGVDGIICGHIHDASVKTVKSFLYCNSGDWVESCTALAENHNGSLGLIQWAEQVPELQTSIIGNHGKDRYSDRCLAPSN